MVDTNAVDNKVVENFQKTTTIPSVAPQIQAKYNLNWNSLQAASAIVPLIMKYGEPSTVDSSRGGSAVWKSDRLIGTIFTRIELRDESVPHCTPMSHYDFIYGYINYDVSPSKFLDISSIMGGISYDKLKKELRARGGCMEEVLVALAIATQIGEGQLSLQYVQANELYKQWIYETNNPEKVDQLYDLISFNLKHQKGDPQPQGFWELAQPSGCSTC